MLNKWNNKQPSGFNSSFCRFYFSAFFTFALLEYQITHQLWWRCIFIFKNSKECFKDIKYQTTALFKSFMFQLILYMFVCWRVCICVLLNIYLTLIAGHYIMFTVLYIQKDDHYQIRYLISTFALSFNVSRFATNIIEINKQCMKIIKGLKLKAP